MEGGGGDDRERMEEGERKERGGREEGERRERRRRKEEGERTEGGKRKGVRKERGRREHGEGRREGGRRGRRVTLLMTHPPVSNIDDGDEKSHQFSHTRQPVRSRTVLMSCGSIEDFTRDKLRHSCILIGGF